LAALYYCLEAGLRLGRSSCQGEGRDEFVSSATLR
jgi:hypothetical protein